MINRLLFSTFILLFLITNEKIISETSKQYSIQLEQHISDKVWEDIYQSINNNRNWPAFHYAMFNKHFEAAEWLLDNHGDAIQLKTPDVKLKRWACPSNDKQDCSHVDCGFEDGFNALELALMRDQPALATKLLHYVSENDLNSRRKEFQGSYLDSWIDEVYNGRYTYPRVDEWVKEFDRNLFNGNVTKSKTTTPLYWAILASDLEPLEILLENNVNLAQTYSETYSNLTYFNFLLPNNIHVDAIETAAAWGNDDALRKVILHKLARSSTPIFMENISDEVIQVFRVYGKNPQEGILLFQAMQANDAIGFETLLVYGANPENIDVQTGKTLFSTALEHPNSQFVDILITQFASQLYLKDAILYDRLDVLNSLLQRGLGNCTDLYEAILANKNDAAILLIEASLLDQKAVEMIIEKDNNELFKQLIIMKYSMTGLSEKIIDKNAIKIAAILFENENQFTEEDLYQCVERGRIEILQTYSRYFSFSDELIENLVILSIKYKQKEIFDFFLELKH